MKKIVLGFAIIAGLTAATSASADYCDRHSACFKVATECAGYADCS